MADTVTEVLVRQADERVRTEAKAEKIRQSAAKGTKKQKASAKLKAQKMVDDLRFKHEDELEELGIDPDGEEVEDLISSLVARVDVAEQEVKINEVGGASVVPGPHMVSDSDGAAAMGSSTPPGSEAKCGYEEGSSKKEADGSGPIKKHKKSKAQRKREAAEEARLQRREEAEREAKEMAGKSPKELEDKAMVEILAEAGLKVYPIIADGNCLFRSVQDQLARLDSPMEITYKDLRKRCADNFQNNYEAYLPFLPSDNMTTLESFNKYCETIRSTSEWGGELEVQAISSALDVEIMVFQTSTPPITFGKGNANGPLRLSYHQHYYHLGAHYNSVVSVTGDSAVSSAVSS